MQSRMLQPLFGFINKGNQCWPSHADEDKLNSIEPAAPLDLSKVRSDFRKETDNIQAVSVIAEPKKEGFKYKKALQLLLREKQHDSKREVKKELAQRITSFIIDPKAIAARATQKQCRWIQVDCDFCDKHFPSRAQFFKHRKLDHPGEPFICQYCYISWNGVYKHEHTHMKPTLFCGICGRNFIFKHQLTDHMRTHDDNSKFYCVDCAKSFASKKTLDRHSQIHLNLSFPCKDCAKVFDTKDATQRHWRGFHGPGYTTLCMQYTFSWPGQRQCHQKKCDNCIKISVEKKAKKFAPPE